MIYSSLYNKNTNEDPKTSTIFEHLLLLPDNIVWDILLKSSRTYNKELPNEIGFLESFEFWPKWNSENTSNSNYVEPDLFIRFNKLDIIVEAKVSDLGGQNEEEWKREIQAYKNEFAEDKKNVVLYAIGGNSDFKSEIIDSCKILKSNWSDLLHIVNVTKQNYKRKILNFSDSSVNRIFDLIIEGFHIMGEHEYKIKTDLSVISYFHTISRMFAEACNNRETSQYSLSKYSEASTASYYIYRFKVDFRDKRKRVIYLGLGMWFKYNELAIEIKPEKGWAEPVAALFKKKIKFSNHYLSPYFEDSGNWYIDTSDEFCKDFSKAETYDNQLNILKKFVDELLENYLKYSQGNK